MSTPSNIYQYKEHQKSIIFSNTVNRYQSHTRCAGGRLATEMPAPAAQSRKK